MFHHVDPDACRVEKPKAPLPEGFIAKIELDGRAPLPKAGVGARRISHLELEAHPRPAERFRARRGGGMRRVHESNARAPVLLRSQQHEPACLEDDLELEPATIEIPARAEVLGHDDRIEIL